MNIEEYIQGIKTCKGLAQEFTPCIAELLPWCPDETLLLIDDEQTVRESIAQILVEEGYEVITAVDGLEGLRCYAEAEERPSLVILDLSRPGMSNIEVLNKDANYGI